MSEGRRIIDYKGYEIITQKQTYTRNPRKYHDNKKNLFNFIGGNKQLRCPDNWGYLLSGNFWIDIANYYFLPFKNKFTDSNVAREWVEKNLFYLKVYLSDRNRYIFSLSKEELWDYELFGVLAIKIEDVFKKYRVKSLNDKVAEKLKAQAREELNDYELYWNGEIYKVEVYRNDRFLGNKEYIKTEGLLDEVVEKAKLIIDERIEDRRMTCAAKLEELLDNDTPKKDIAEILVQTFNREPNYIFFFND